MTAPIRTAPAGAAAPGLEPAVSRVRATVPLLAIDRLAVSFVPSDGGEVTRAVSGVSLTVHAGSTTAVVGESGCGKSVTALTTLRLLPEPPARIDGGRILLDGRDLLRLSEKELLAVRGREVAMIFQEPMSSLNPVHTIGDQIMEAVLLHRSVDLATARAIATESLVAVGVEDAAARLDDHPHVFSGGMRQRVMIAMALACQPRLLLADEPTTALDVTIQAQILELLRQLQRTRGLGILLITHNLGVVAENADAVCVMYAGRVMEYASVPDLFARPLHPYTRGLFASMPTLQERREHLTTVDEVVGDPGQFAPLPVGGAGATGRGAVAVPWWRLLGATSIPTDDHLLVEVAPNHWVGCLRTDELAAMPHRSPDIAPIDAR